MQFELPKFELAEQWRSHCESLLAGLAKKKATEDRRSIMRNLNGKVIDKAIVLIEDSSDPREAERLRRSRQFWTDEAISQHVGFWISLKSHLYPYSCNTGTIAVCLGMLKSTR